MRVCRILVLTCTLVAILAYVVVGAEYGIPSSTNTDGYAAKPTSRLRLPEETDQPDQPRSHPLEEIDTGPDPFFADLTDGAPPEVDGQGSDANAENTGPTYYIELYENESRGRGRRFFLRWLDLRTERSFVGIGWTSKDGSAALPPEEIRPPDLWGWVSEWKIDRSGRRDLAGWEYARDLGKFGSLRVPRLKRFNDRFRRRRWLRAMRSKRGKQQQEIDDTGLQLESISEATGVRSPALRLHAYEYEGDDDFKFDLENDVDVDLFLASDMRKLSDKGGASLQLPTFGHALTAVKGWWTEEFTFRGFGVGFVKPIFRGMLLRPDVGVGIRLPLTLHFRSWEKQETLPSISASFFVLWPPAVQVSHALSYPAELLQEWATTAVRKVTAPSKEALQARQRKEAVQRLGVSVGVRFSATYGFQWWLAPYFFLLPGVRVLWHLYQSFMVALLSTMALMQRSDGSESDRANALGESEEPPWAVALRIWAAAKTSGLGYSLYYSGSRLGGAVLVNFMPFFLPRFSADRSKFEGKNSSAAEEGIERDALSSAAAPETEDETSSGLREVVTSAVAFGENNSGLNATEIRPRKGGVLQAA